MKTIEFKSGTREEIINFMRSKSSGKLNLIKGEFGIPSNYDTSKSEVGKYYEYGHNTIENQIDAIIEDGNPIVSVRLMGWCCPEIREMFFVTDYGDVRVNIELEKLDNLELRNKRISLIKRLMSMECDAEELWDRILKVLDEFKGKTLHHDDIKE